MQIESKPFNPEALLALVGGDYAQLKEILDLFIETFGDSPARIRAALDSGDTAEADRLLHQLKGTVANIWPEELYRETEKLEMLLNSGSFSADQLGPWHDCFEATFQSIQLFIQKHCS